MATFIELTQIHSSFGAGPRPQPICVNMNHVATAHRIAEVPGHHRGHTVLIFESGRELAVEETPEQIFRK